MIDGVRSINRKAKRVIESFFYKMGVYKPKRVCTVCGHRARKFIPIDPMYENNLVKYGFKYSLDDLETLNVREYTCPGCGACDRERLYVLFFKKILTSKSHIKLIDFAPARSLRAWLTKQKSIEYRCADLFMHGVDDKIDLMDMHLYEDNKFDIFICSHILEHVEDDLQAMKELYRILKPGGIGIVMVPIFLSNKETYSDPLITDEGLRWRYFAQNDHVRIYSRLDFIQRLGNTGFKIKEVGKNDFSKENFEMNAITDKSVLYVVSK